MSHTVWWSQLRWLQSQSGGSHRCISLALQALQQQQPLQPLRTYPVSVPIRASALPDLAFMFEVALPVMSALPALRGSQLTTRDFVLLCRGSLMGW